MAIYQYFKKASVLPNPDGPLSSSVPSVAIAEANKKVQPILAEEDSKQTGKRGQYLVYTAVYDWKASSRIWCYKYPEVL